MTLTAQSRVAPVSSTTQPLELLPVTALVLSDGQPTAATSTAAGVAALVEDVVVLERAPATVEGTQHRLCEWTEATALLPVVTGLRTPWLLVLSAGERLHVSDLAALRAELLQLPDAVELPVDGRGPEVRLHVVGAAALNAVGGASGVMTRHAAVTLDVRPVPPAAEEAATSALGTTSEMERVREHVAGLEEKRLLQVVRRGRDVCWIEPEDDHAPLVTVRIATYDRPVHIVDRAIKSALRQTYSNIEVLVVGDGCDTATADALAGLAEQDIRVRFLNLPARGLYPEDAAARWMVAGAAPMNAALQLARGAWLAPCDDDDELTPDHVEVLLHHAKQHRLEMVYSQAAHERPDGRWEVVGSVPLRAGYISHGSVLYSLGLRHFPHNPTAWQLPEPGDWNLWRRMANAGARIGFLERVTYRHYMSEAAGSPEGRHRTRDHSRQRRLHLGCGPNRMEGWVNIDIEPEYAPDVLHDLTTGLPAPDGSCDAIYSEHVFEHFPLEVGMMLMRESLRALRSGGVLRIAMPDLAHVVDKYRHGWRDQSWLGLPGLEFVDTACRMLNVGLREWGHTYVYDEEDLRLRLRQSGFHLVRRCEAGESDVPLLQGLETREDSRLVLEAVKS